MLQLSGWVSKVKDSMTDVLSSFGIDDGEPGGEAVSAVRPVDDELEIDDSLSVQEKIVKYLRSDLILHRLYLVRELAEYGLQLGYAETVAHLLPLLSEIKADVEPVIRQALVEQIPILATQLKEVPESGVVDIINVLLPIVVGLTRDSNPQVRLSSTEALIGLAATLPLHLLEKHLLPVIDSLATDTSQEEYRIEAARLVQHLAKSMGSRLCIEFAVPLMLKMAKDNFRIRKVVAANIGLLAESVGAEVTTAKLLPLFVKMSGDEIWGVRKSCAESLVALSSVLSNSDRLQHLVPIFQKLAEDQSRWVRNSAFEHLGHFIVTFQDSEVPASLVKYYTEMVLQTNQKFSDSELVNYCAFDFPGVILTLGATRWNEVREAYFKLCADLQWKVRRPLAHSLHEVATILGGEATVVDLLSIFETFLKDLDEVKVGVVRHLAAFLQILPAEHREQYLSVISDVTNETSNWRFRKLMARQLGALSSLYGPETVAERLVPISVQLCQDSVAGVRRVAHREVGLLINRLENGRDEGKMRDDYIRQIVSFGSQSVDSSYVERQIFAQVCGHVCEQVSPACFMEHFLPGLLLLSTDRIPNVRLTVAQVLVLLLEQAAYESNESVQKTLQLLQKDKDRDVVFYAQPQNLVRKPKEKAKTK